MNDGPINLNRERKSRARDDARKRADANATKHGRTKAARDLEAARQTQADTRLDGHKTDD